jgi:hypothetical protein
MHNQCATPEISFEGSTESFETISYPQWTWQLLACHAEGFVHFLAEAWPERNGFCVLVRFLTDGHKTALDSRIGPNQHSVLETSRNGHCFRHPMFEKFLQSGSRLVVSQTSYLISFPLVHVVHAQIMR